jgi:hypothetical protein
MQTFVGLALKPLQTQLDRIEAKLDALTKQEQKDMAVLDDDLTALTTQVAANTSVIGSAVAMINGIGAQIAAAVAAATAAGATPAQLAAVVALQSTIQNDDGTLSAAILANTPQASQTPPPAAQALAAKLKP